MAKTVMRFRNMTLGKQLGELARFRVLGGPDAGTVFVITAPKVTVGRGEENDLVLTDLKASRRHFELTVNMGIALLRDIGSSHGVSINGNIQKQSPLKTGDRVGLGETVLEFFVNDAGNTQMMVMPPLTSNPNVGTGNSGLTQFIPRPGQTTNGSKSGAGALAQGQGGSFFERNKKLAILVGGLVAVALLLPEVEKKQRAKNKYVDPLMVEAERSISSLERPQIDPNLMRTAENYFKEGFREYRAKNWLRARVAFETALQIYNDHAQSRIYLESTKKAMEEEATEHIKTAKRDEEANRLRSAFMHYDAVKRLFSKDQSNPLFKEADAKATEMDKKMKEADKY